MDFLEFPDALQEVRGAMNQGRLKLTSQGIVFKNNKTGKVDQIQTADIDLVNWQRLAGGFGLRVFLKNGSLHRFGGLKENDFEKLSKFFLHTMGKTLSEKTLSLKGWNWGTASFHGSVLSFDVDKSTAFEVPLMNVSHCTTAKNEVTLEFHQNDDAAVSLMELRFHVPSDSTGEGDPAQAFHDNVMSKASIIQATGDAIATFKEIQCLTPRGRYDIKVFPSFIQLHGKTFDYKIPMTTVLRLFLLPHKDQRQMFFVVSLDPPIKQGQTRYHFLILLFNKEEETTLQIGLPEKEIEERYEGKLQQEMTGPTFQVMSRIMKVLVQRKITVPGNFVGNSGTSAVGCSYKAAAGFMYPLERGFIYVHKPPIHIRFEEVSSINFARSGGSTRSFDFEVELKSGVVHNFCSIEKEEYMKLYDFITSKKLRVKNRGQMDAPNYTEDDLVDSDVEDEPDAYMARVKAEAKEREDIGGGMSGDDDDDDDSSDVSFNPGNGSGSEVAEEYDSNAPSSSSSDEDGEGGGSGKEEKKKSKEKKEKPKKAKTVPEGRKPRKKKERDENKPKRPLSAYFLWLNENRERMKKKYPKLSMVELTKKAGEEWKEVKDKTKWEKLAEKGKKEYEVAMAEYKASLGDGEGSGGGGGKKEKSAKEKGAKKAQKPSPQKSPQKSGTPYKSREYISSSEGSGSSSEGEKGEEEDSSKRKKTPKSSKVKEEKVTPPASDGDDDDTEDENEKEGSRPIKQEKKSSEEEESAAESGEEDKNAAKKVKIEKESDGEEDEEEESPAASDSD